MPGKSGHGRGAFASQVFDDCAARVVAQCEEQAFDLPLKGSGSPCPPIGHDALTGWSALYCLDLHHDGAFWGSLRGCLVCSESGKVDTEAGA
jgi:hypothetical protein